MQPIQVIFLAVESKRVPVHDSEKSGLGEASRANNVERSTQVIGNRRLHQEDQEKVAFQLALFIVNGGDRDVRTAAIEVMLPDEWDDNSGSAGFEQDDAYRFSGEEDVGFKIGSRTVHTIVPGTDAYVGTIFASARPGTYQLQWLAKTEQGCFSFPVTEPPGEFASFEVSVAAP